MATRGRKTGSIVDEATKANMSRGQKAKWDHIRAALAEQESHAALRKMANEGQEFMQRFLQDIHNAYGAMQALAHATEEAIKQLSYFQLVEPVEEDTKTLK